MPGRKATHDGLYRPERLSDLHGTIELRAPVKRSEVAPEFLQGMVNRMAVSNHKYGDVARAAGPGGTIDPVACILNSVAKYEETQNTEYLMDAGNYCMIAWMCPRDGDFFEATDSKDSAGLIKTDGSHTTTYTKEHRA